MSEDSSLVCVEKHCRNKQCISSHTGRQSVRCADCLSRNALRSRKSWKNRSARDQKIAAAEQETLLSNQRMWKMDRTSRQSEEKMFSALARERALIDENEQLRQALKVALETASKGCPDPERFLAEAARLHSESRIIVMLDAMQARLDEVASARSFDFAQLEQKQKEALGHQLRSVKVIARGLEGVLVTSQRRLDNKDTNLDVDSYFAFTDDEEEVVKESEVDPLEDLPAPRPLNSSAKLKHRKKKKRRREE